MVRKRLMRRWAIRFSMAWLAAMSQYSCQIRKCQMQNSLLKRQRIGRKHKSLLKMLFLL